MHIVHHSRWSVETNSNYTTFLTVWDRLFGSFRPSTAPAALGLAGLDDAPSQTLAGMIGTPWQRLPDLPDGTTARPSPSMP
jgi:sterol desaturase/sphingolipid hydroxylase (fatty acid hydroxylase superfamily)